MASRAKSPVPKKDKDSKGDKKEETFKHPPRPEGLRGNVLILYATLAVVMAFFVFVGESMKHPIPEGQFEKRDGTMIKISDFDVKELGPYPKCHPHHGEHHNGTAWVKNDDVPSSGPFHPGHPENPEWVNKSNDLAMKELEENRFKWVGLQPSLHLLSMASLCLLISCKHGVWMFTESAETRDPEETQFLKTEDAYWFPITGSCMLFGLFLVYKYLSSEWIKFALSCGIVILCTFAIGTNLAQFVAVIREKAGKPLFRIPYVDQNVTTWEIVGYLVGAAMAVAYMLDKKNWILHNVFGISFCIVGIKTICIPSYKTGAIMLIGLFFYDIFWVFGSKSVFGSNVMVTVATKVEGPITLLFPRRLDGCGNLSNSMLGLGDIVVPGIFLAFLAKWDAIKLGEKASKSFVYFNVTMVFYVMSLVTTVGIMLVFNAAQPALLYIVPYVLIASSGVAIARGEFWELLAFAIPEEEEKDKKKPEEKKKD